MSVRVAAAQSHPVLEGMEPRILLSGGPAGDSTDTFQWSGFQFQAAATAPPALAAGAGSAAGAGPTASTVLEYAFVGSPSLQPDQSGVLVSLGGASQWVSANDPIVPYRESKILLPPGYQIVSVDVQPGFGTVVAQGVPLMAAATPLPLIDGQDPPAADDAGAPVPAGESFPAGQEVTFSTQVMCGYSLGVLAVFPVSFNAADGTLTYHPHIQVTVTAAPAVGGDDAPLRRDAADLQRVLDLVDNDAAALEYPLPAGAAGMAGAAPAAELPVAPLSGALPSAGSYQYVLVTSPALAGTFQQLVNQKLARGISATMVTTDYIYAHYSSAYANENDNAGKIRAFLKDAYTNWGTHYVLLGGDTGQVPTRAIYCVVGAYTADLSSDVYYADLDGPYNYDADTHWGESNDGAAGRDVDLAAELSVGRAPVDTVSEARNFINKTILYENTPQPNATRMVQIGEKLDETPTWGEDSLDYIAEQSFPANLQVTQLYQRNGTNTTATVKAALNASPNFVNHLGHSSYTTNASLTRADVDGLTNAFPYIIYSQGCNAGQFEIEDAIAEHHLYAPGGAVAAVMNSNYGWYMPGDPTAAGTDWALSFWSAIFVNDVLAVGDAHYKAKADHLSILQWGTSDRWTFFASTLFGDPETHVYFPTPTGPHVTGQSPAGNNAPGPSRLRVQFGEPMDPTSFSPTSDLVSFTAPGGLDLRGRVTGYAWEDFYTLDIFFAPQTAPGTYEMVLGPGILDSTGTAMDQDGDGTAGEPAQDAYHATFAINSAGSGTGTIYQADMTGDPHWTLDGGSAGWAWGVPAGAGGDPTAGHTGPGVLGYNLNGVYPNGMAATQYAVTPVIDCSAFKNVTLSFWRWLRVQAQPYDNATIDVTNDGVTWHNVWSNGTAVTTDTAWSLKTIDISAYADGRSSVQVRWGMGPTDTTLNYGGWNLDDVAITGAMNYPTVLAQFPAARALAGLDHLDVALSTPISPASITAEDFAITGPNGAVAVTGVQLVAGSTYRATFQPQYTLGAYQFTVGPNVTNLLGNPMDQNGDGTAGQAGVDAYHGSFQIVAADTDGAGVAASTPAGMGTAAFASFTFTFDEDMDTASFSPADVAAFTGPGGSNLLASVTGFLWLDARNLKVSFRPQQALGTYAITIGPDIRDDEPDGNAMDQDANGTAGQAGDSYTARYRIFDTDLSGTVYVDGNLSGTRDAGENGSPGRTVYLDTNGNGMLDGGEPSVLTGSDGSFDFASLAPGTYRVRQILPAGWVRTSPAAGYYTATLASGTAVANQDFGDADSGTFLPAGTPERPTQGVRYALYHHDHTAGVDDLSALTPVARGPAGNFDISLRDREEDFGFIYSGYVNVPADAVYTFYLDSHDGSKLYIDGIAVVDNGGYHPAQEAQGRIGLKAGYHAITVEYLQGTGVPLLAVDYEGAGLAKQAIPDSALRFTANLPPVAADDAYQVAQDGVLSVPAAAGVLANDTDADAGPAGLSVVGASVGLPAHGQLQLQADGSLVYTPAPGYWGGDSFTYQAADGFDTSAPATVSITVAPTPAVVGRHVFYNNSAWDNALQGRTDDDAIAPDKRPLLPGGQAAFENYTSYSLGLNGVMIDVLGVPAGGLAAEDFVFRMGNTNTPAAWAAAPAPAVTVRRGAGANGADRVSLIWPDHAITGRWLQVTLRADANTQLPADDVFYFGNAPGDVGNSAADAKVTTLDVSLLRSNLTTFLDPAVLTNPYDIDRDGKVDTMDVSLARADLTAFGTALALIAAPPADIAPAMLGGTGAIVATAPAAPATTTAPTLTSATTAAALAAATIPATPATAATGVATMPIMASALAAPMPSAPAAVPSGQTPVSPIPAAPATLEGVLIDILSGARALPLPL